ncbi:MAG: ATP-binding protein [Magnetospirillum gryphiswaldense]|nr:ATP-binding protein [Magnetospirillum gryphiswaldense]
MAVIRRHSIRNFRGIKLLDWCPGPQINCLIGPGDSGKSTLIDSIELCLSARRYATFGEADVHLLDLTQATMIEVTLGELDEALLDFDAYANFLRGFHRIIGMIEDEPRVGLETVITVRLTVGDDLIPRWGLYSDRAAALGIERDLSAKDRARIAPTRLGGFTEAHLAWGQRSVLGKVADERPDAGAALAAARSAAKGAFGLAVGALFDDALKGVNEVAVEFAVDVAGGAVAMLDTQQVSMGNGAIALHDGRGIPLRNMGLGSSRLLVAGLQRRAGTAGISLVDEVEHGLEPYRIARALHLLGAKGGATGQTFMTSHSPVVLRELSANQLFIVRRPRAVGGAHATMWAGGDESRQKTLRACAEAFLAPSVLVCEGKTEMGLIRGLDLYSHDNGHATLAHYGVTAADGGGSEAASRALAFASMGYRTALLRDNDRELAEDKRRELATAGVPIFEWEGGLMFEAALFHWCPDDTIAALLAIAADTRGEETIEADIRSGSAGAFGHAECNRAPVTPQVREMLGVVAGRRSWFKLIEPGERIGREVVGPKSNLFADGFRGVIWALYNWVRA